MAAAKNKHRNHRNEKALIQLGGKHSSLAAVIEQFPLI